MKLFIMLNPPDLFNFDYKPEKTGINVTTEIPRNNEEKERLGRPVNHR